MNEKRQTLGQGTDDELNGDFGYANMLIEDIVLAGSPEPSIHGSGTPSCSCFCSLVVLVTCSMVFWCFFQPCALSPDALFRFCSLSLTAFHCAAAGGTQNKQP